MRQKVLFMTLLMVAGMLVLAGTAMSGSKKRAKIDKRLVAHGRYLVQIAGCNDCHTPGYLLNDGKVPEDKWLIGDNFGWRGPWGTTYASNLRNFINGMTEKQWITTARALKRRPPMPWFAVNIMTERDLKAIYYYVKSMGSAGGPAPDYLPPNVEPKTPYAQFPSPPTPSK